MGKKPKKDPYIVNIEITIIIYLGRGRAKAQGKELLRSIYSLLYTLVALGAKSPKKK